MDTFVTVTQAAKIGDLSRQAIVDAIKRKRLVAHRTGHRFKINTKDLEVYFETRNKVRPIIEFPKDYLKIEEVAKIKNVSRMAVYLAIKENRLKASREGALWKVHLSELNNVTFRDNCRRYINKVAVNQ